MKRKAAIYLRISQDRDGRAEGVKRQEDDCRDIAKARRFTVADVYTDNDKSAWNGKHRPEWDRLLTDAEDGRFQALIAWHDDRLWRNVTEQQLVFQMLNERGIEVIVAGGRDYRTASMDDSVLSGVQALFAQKESADKSRRIRRKAIELAKEGKLNGRGGKRPFGYHDDFVTICEEEAELVREAVERALMGEPLGRITRDWNQRGLTAVQGGVWHPASLKRILTSGRICGWREHHGELVAPAVWPGIIDRDTYDRLKARLCDPARSIGTQARFLLSGGLAVCGKCGANLAGRRRRGRTGDPEADDDARVYACTKRPARTSCGSIFCKALGLEDYVTEIAIAALDTPMLNRAMRAQAKKDDREAELLKTIRKDEESLEQVARDHYVDDVIGRAEFLAARQSLEARIEQSKHRLAGIDQRTLLADVPSGAEALREAWSMRGLEWQRALLRTVLERVVVHPTVHGRNFFNSDRVELVWRA